MIERVGSVFVGLLEAVPNFVSAVTHPAAWLNWSEQSALINFIYYGASSELLSFLTLLFLLVLAVGVWRRNFLWSVVRGLEFTGNWVGRVAAWSGLVMVLQQVMIVFLQRIFRVSEITIGPLGYAVSKDLSWFGEELKLYNAIVVCMCCAYTFIQGGHVRVDLFYANARYRTKRIIDIFGSLCFMLPVMLIIWLYGWFFLWRHLVTPKVAATDTLELLQRKSRLLKWNVETIGFSPSGFDGYFLFKVLLVAFAGMMILQAVAFFYRSLLELLEGPESENRYLDRDVLTDITGQPQAPAN
ncbi:MAG: C4-dicarboxylate ABC transporter permease [Rhodobacteraceae bacterium]|nr:C4-dicarboxylate ABC transporter permease [Paracoccaceae bacterium]